MPFQFIISLMKKVLIVPIDVLKVALGSITANSLFKVSAIFFNRDLSILFIRLDVRIELYRSDDFFDAVFFASPTVNECDNFAQQASARRLYAQNHEKDSQQ
jgi:hypothetical protein